MVEVTEVSTSEGDDYSRDNNFTDTTVGGDGQGYRVNSESEEGDGDGDGDPSLSSLFQVWQSTIVVIIAVLVIQSQVFFASSLFNVLLRWWVLPKGNAFNIPFHPDYQENHPSAYIPMLEDKYLTSGRIVEKPQEGTGLLVREGSYFDVWLKLSLPYSAKNEELFQVQVELLALNSSVVFSDRKSCLMSKKSFLYKHLKLLAFAPLYLSGFMDQEQEVLYFPVVDRFRQGREGKLVQQGSQVVSQLKVSLLPQKGNKPPEIYEAEAHILVKLNIIQHFMYHYPVTSFVLFSFITALFLNSTLLGILLLVFIAITFGLSDSTGDSTSEEESDKEEGYTEATSGGDSGFAHVGDEITSKGEEEEEEEEEEENSSSLNDAGEETTQIGLNTSFWGKTTTQTSSTAVSRDDASNETKVVKAASVREHITETRLRKA